MPVDRAEPLLTTAEVARLLQVHPKQVYRLLRRGLPGRRVGGEWRFVRAEVLGWNTGGGPRPGASTGGVAEGDEPPSTGASPPPLIAANGDVVIEELLRLLNAGEPPLFGFVQADRGAATRLLESGAVLAAGSHGGPPPARLGGLRLARLHLVAREVGLAGAARKPPHVTSQLLRLRVASRPPTAGIVAHLDAALRKAGVDPKRIRARAARLDSHRDVVLSILRGEADVGLTTHAWAHRAGLAFRPLATESYGLVVRATDLGDARLVRLCEVAQGAAFRARLSAVPGYDPAGAGDIRYDPEPEPAGGATSNRAPRGG